MNKEELQQLIEEIQKKINTGSKMTREDLAIILINALESEEQL